MNECPRQRDSTDKAVHDIKEFVHGLWLANPDYTGHFTVHAKNGVVLDIEATKRYKLNK